MTRPDSRPGSPAMHRDILLTNREAVTRWIDAVVGTLGEIRQTIASGEEDASRVARRILFRSPGRSSIVGDADHPRGRATAGDSCRTAAGERVGSHGSHVSRRIRQAAANAAETRRLVASGPQSMNASDPGERSSRVEREVSRSSSAPTPPNRRSRTSRPPCAARAPRRRARLAKSSHQPWRLREWPQGLFKIGAALLLAIGGGVYRGRVPPWRGCFRHRERDRLLLTVGTSSADRVRAMPRGGAGRTCVEETIRLDSIWERIRPPRGPKGPSR